MTLDCGLEHKFWQQGRQLPHVLDAARLEVQRGTGVQLAEHYCQHGPALGRHRSVREAQEAEVWAEVATGEAALDVGTDAPPGVGWQFFELAIVSRCARICHGALKVQEASSRASRTQVADKA